MEWLRAHKDENFFLYLHFMSPHTPYNPPRPFRDLPWVPEMPAKFEPFVENPSQLWPFIWRELEADGPNRATEQDVEYLSSAYDAEISNVDWWIGVLHRELGRLQLVDDTLIVVISDHGESFFEHGEFLHRSHLYNENLVVPVLFSNPRLFPGPERLDELIGIIDVFPTIVDYCDGESLDQFQGRSILSSPAAETIYGEKRTRQANGLISTEDKLQSRDWSIIRQRPGDYELYNLVEDPGEQLDLFHEQRDVSQSHC